MELKAPPWRSAGLRRGRVRDFSDSFCGLDFSHLTQTGWVAHRPSAQREAISRWLHTPLSDVGDEARRAALRKGLLRDTPSPISQVGISSPFGKVSCSPTRAHQRGGYFSL